MEVVILGGGFAGMAAAYRLGSAGVPCELWEAGPELGGLAGCHTVAGERIEKFYHHFKVQELDAVALIEKMGLKGCMQWTDTGMAFYVDKKLYPLSSLMDLVRFAPFSVMDRFRFARGMCRVMMSDGSRLEGVSAGDWAIKEFGANVFERMINPMLFNKFGMRPEMTSAAFLHWRIKNVLRARSLGAGGPKLGYLDGSNEMLIKALSNELADSVHVKVSTPLERIEMSGKGFALWSPSERLDVRWIVNTLPLPVFADIPGNLDFRHNVRYQAAVCATIAVDEEVSLPYWTNVLDPDITFRLVVNQSALHSYRKTMLYCANYVVQGDALLVDPPEKIMDRYVHDLATITGKITVVDYKPARTRWATPVFDVDFGEEVKHLNSRFPGMIFAGAIDVYPYARTVNGVLASGYRAAASVLQRMTGSNGGSS